MSAGTWLRSATRRLPWGFAVAVLSVGLLAPLLVNDVPLIARVDGQWSLPAVADLFGEPPPGPHDLTWKQWWSRLAPDGPDWALMPPWPYGPLETDMARACAAPSAAHPFGCDDTGRDVLARLVYGAGTAVWIGLPAVLVAASSGTVLGAWAGLAGGAVDVLVLRLIELFLCFPTLLFLLFASAFFGSSALGLTAVLAGLLWTGFARIVRGELLSLRDREFVLVARGLGVPQWRILLGHLLPQVSSQIGVTAAFALAAAIVTESTLSFLGIGSGAASSWGTMLRQGSRYAAVGAWHLWLFPAVTIVAVVVCCHVLADRLRRGVSD